MITPNQIDLKELEEEMIALGVTKELCPKLVRYIKKDYADKLNKIEKEIDMFFKKEYMCDCDQDNMCSSHDTFNKIKQIIRREFTKE